MRWLVVLFVLVPLVELYLLVWLSTLIGFFPTLAITLVTGIVGGTMAKREGLRVYRKWRQALERFETPEEGILDGILVLVGGTLLITPGVLTDTLGFVLLLPPTRRAAARRLRRLVDGYVRRARLRVTRTADQPSSRGVVETTGRRLD